MTRKLEWLLLVGVLLLAAIMRIQAASTSVIDNPVRADAAQYYFGALNLERWKVFSVAPPADQAPAPSAYRAPVTSVLLLPFVSLPPTERMLFHFNLLQSAMDVATVLLVFLFFRPIAGAGLALGAAFLAAISPHLISLTTYMLSETGFTFFLAGGICCTGIALARGETRLGVLGGLFLGTSALTRPTTEYLPLFMLVLLYWLLDRKTFVKVIVPASLVALGVVVAWKLRNLTAIGALSDLTLSVDTIHHGMYPDMMYNDDPRSFSMPYRFDPLSPQMTSTRNVLAILWQRVQDDPGRYLHWFLIGKPLAFLQWSLQDGGGDIFVYPVKYSPYFDKPLFGYTYLFSRWVYAPLVLAGILGLVLAVVRPATLCLNEIARKPVLMLAVVFLYFMLVHFVGCPMARYSVPIRPYLCGLGLMVVVILVLRVWKIMRARRNQIV